MATLKLLIVLFLLAALAAALPHKRFGRSKVFCCALCAAACACIVAVTAVWRWLPPTFRSEVRMEALRDEPAEQLWLRNAFGVFGGRSKPTFPELSSGNWQKTGDGLHWYASAEAASQTDAVVLSLPAAERYALFFQGNRQTGKVRVTDPTTGASEVIDTHRDSEEWEVIVQDIALDGMPLLRQMRRALALSTAACVAASGTLFALLYALLRRHRAALAGAWRSFTRALLSRAAKSPRAQAPLDARRWSRRILCLLVLSLIPLLLISACAYPSFDDFVYGAPTRHAWLQTGSIGTVMQTAIRVARESYDSWQGSFASVFLMTLEPDIWGGRCYALTPLVLIGSLIASTWLFARAVLGKRQYGVPCWLSLFFCIQYGGQSESFYWWNGGIYYTFFYSASLMLFACLLYAHRTAPPAKRAALTLCACLLAAFIGAGNYVTALLSGELLALLIVYRALQREGRWRIPLAALLCLGGTLAISVIAPGNALRQANLTPMPVPAVLYTSFLHALAYLWENLRLEYALGLFVALPFLYRAAEQSRHAFRYPLLVTLASFCAFASQFAPHLIAASKDGPPRLMAIIFYSAFWCVGGNAFYWCGWLARRRPLPENRRVFCRWAAAPMAALLLAACVATSLLWPITLSGVSAAHSLLSGEAARYDRAMQAQVSLLRDTHMQEARVPAAPQAPVVVMGAGMQADPNDWINTSAATYYGKTSVSIQN